MVHLVQWIQLIWWFLKLIFHSFKFTKPPLILSFLKLEKKREKCKKNGKTKKKTRKIQKTQKQNKREKQGGKRKKKRRKNGKMDLSICMFFVFFAFFDLLFVCFFFVFILFLSRQKAKKKKKKKANRKSKKKNNKNAKGQVHFFPIFSPFLTFFVFPFILLPVFFGFEVLFFDVPCVFLFFAFFSSLKNIKTSGRGEHNHSHSYVLTRGYPIQKKWQRFSKLPSSNLHRKKLRSFAASCRHPFPPRDPWESGYHLPDGRTEQTPTWIRWRSWTLDVSVPLHLFRILRKPGWWLSHPSEKY